MWMMLFVVLWSALASHAWAQKATSIEYQDVTIHNARTAVHDGTFVNVNQSNSVGFDVQISGTATVKFRVSGAGRFGWNDLTCDPSNSTTGVTSATATGFYQCNVATGDVVSARLDVCTACTVSVVARTSTAIYGKSSGGGAGGGGVITDVQDGAGNSTMDAVNNAQRVTAVTAIQTTNIVPSSGLTLQKAGFNITTATTTTIISATAGQTVNVYGLWFYPGDIACDITLQDSGATNLIMSGATIDVLANQGANFQLQADPWFTSSSGTGVQIVTAAACHLVGIVYYTKG